MTGRQEQRKWIERYRHRYRYTPGCKLDALPGVYKEAKKITSSKKKIQEEILCVQKT